MSDIKEKILAIVNTCIDNANISLSQSDKELSELGMDSITFIRIVVALEEAFNIEIPDEYLLITSMGTINKMASVVAYTINKRQ